MIIFALKERQKNEKRAALDPAAVKKLDALSQVEIWVESGIGEHCNYSDADYKASGAKISKDKKSLLKKADLILKVQQIAIEDIKTIKKEAILISFIEPFSIDGRKLLAALKKSEVTTICMELIPRSTRAQKMDAISSQASLSGYAAICYASNHLNQAMPMMTTPAGTISPVKFFIIGAGVVGLQAIATAKRLGARVEAFDTREAAQEQIISLGAKALQIDLGPTGETKQGYAIKLTKEQIEIQRKALEKAVASSDAVITTAQIFSKKAPIIITKGMVDKMKRGSLIIDLAIETGGNVEGIVSHKNIITKNGVLLVGKGNFANKVAVSATQMYASNLSALIDEYIDKGTGIFQLDLEDDILSQCVASAHGKYISPIIKEG